MTHAIHLGLKEHILFCHPLALSRQRAVVSELLQSLEHVLAQFSFNSTAVVIVLRCCVAIVAVSHLPLFMEIVRRHNGLVPILTPLTEFKKNGNSHNSYQLQWNVPLWHTSSSNFFIGRLGQQGHHRYHHTVRQASLRAIPFQQAPSGESHSRELPPDLLSPSPLSLPSPGMPGQFSPHHSAGTKPPTSPSPPGSPLRPSA